MSLLIPPQHPDIDTSAFMKTLTRTTASYKFFWLLALLDILTRRNFDSKQPISIPEMTAAMLKHAWTPVCRFNLSLGKQDKIRSYIERIEKRGGVKWTDCRSIEIASGAINKSLSDKVLYFWPRPFVEKEIKIGPKARDIKTAIVCALQEKSAGDSPPPYRIDRERGCIHVHSRWANYFKQNADLVRGWCLWSLASYLQVRNPNIPAVISKILADEHRPRALTRQRDFWIQIARKIDDLECIYSGRRLQHGFELDHYVPWSFVGHDGLWNLIPAHPSVNSSKGDNLPHNRYLEKMAQMHHKALTVRQNSFPGKWNDLVESYIAHLRIPANAIADFGRLHRAYVDFVPPLIDLAKANRFKGEWTYDSGTPSVSEAGVRGFDLA